MPTTLVLLALSLSTACATSAREGPSRRAWGLTRSPSPGLEFDATPWRKPDDPARNEARRAEAARALEAMWSIAGSTHVLGAGWEFRLSIIIGFQNEARETAILAARFTLEQIAYSVVGGLALKGAWVLSFLSKGGQTAVRWFRDLLVRAPVVSRHMKAQDVERVMEVINRHYRRWFDKVYAPKDAAALARAEQSALSEIAQIKARLAH